MEDQLFFTLLHLDYENVYVVSRAVCRVCCSCVCTCAFVLTERLVEPLHPGQIQTICCIQATALGSSAAFYCCQARLALNELETQTHARQKFHSTVLFKKMFILHAFFFFFKEKGCRCANTALSSAHINCAAWIISHVPSHGGCR